MLLTVLLLGVGVSAVIYNFVRPARDAQERDRITAAALAQAKAALIGYAAGVVLVGPARPGDLPCPDQDNDGDADAVPACDTPALALGRLPWRTLGLPDPRDGDGERLWYAVSVNFKNNTRTPCLNPGDAGCLNSDARGTITVRRPDNSILHDGTNPDAFVPSGVVAVIIAPGRVVQRLGAGAPQDRSAAGINNPVNYLEIAASGEDNAVFADLTTDGFIHGPIYDPAGNAIVNDRIITITWQDLMPLLQRRVAKEVMNCLEAYAAVPRNSGRYPWAAPVTDLTYGDQSGNRFGRIPDTFAATFLGSALGFAPLVCPLPLVGPVLCMSTSWPGAPCNLTIGTWWTNWKEHVFYGVAEAYQPGEPLGIPLAPLPMAPGGPCGGACPGPNCCLQVSPPSNAFDKRVVVAVAGKRLLSVSCPGGQPRTSALNKQTAANYVEGTNDNTTGPQTTYEQRAVSSCFNDVVLYQQ